MRDPTAPGGGTVEPAHAEELSQHRARRPAGDVDPRLQLLRVLLPGPARLERQLGKWVPAHPDGGRIERPGLDVPAVLVRLPPVEPRRLDLHLTHGDAGGDDPEADMGGIEPVMADRRLRIV